jgi:hypothetical protein
LLILKTTFDKCSSFCISSRFSMPPYPASPFTKPSSSRISLRATSRS